MDIHVKKMEYTLLAIKNLKICEAIRNYDKKWFQTMNPILADYLIANGTLSDEEIHLCKLRLFTVDISSGFYDQIEDARFQFPNPYEMSIYWN